MAEAIRVLIVEGEPQVRRLLRGRHAAREGVRVVWDTVTAQDGYRLTALLEPDPVLVGHSLLDGLGVLAALEFRLRFPGIPVIVMSVNDSLPEGRAALRAGASAYCGMAIGEEELVDIMRRATTLCDPPPPGVLGPSDTPASAIDRLVGTDPREQEIVRMIAEGKSDAETARVLGIDVQVVKNHVTATLRKLGPGDVIRATV